MAADVFCSAAEGWAAKIIENESTDARLSRNTYCYCRFSREGYDRGH